MQVIITVGHVVTCAGEQSGAIDCITVRVGHAQAVNFRDFSG